MPAARSVMTRRAPGPDLVVRYGDSVDQLIDVHLPADPAAAPLLILLHGGFWRREFDRVHTRPMAQALRRLGFAIATAEYRRGPDSWPAMRDDVTAVREHVRTRFADTAPGRVSDAPIRVVGHSAGGHLALWWALAARGDHRDEIDRVVALAPVADLARAHADGLGDHAVRDLLGFGPELRREDLAEADPGPALTTYAGPVHLVHGDRDEQVPIEHSRALAARAPAVKLHELPGVAHLGLIDPESAAWPHVVGALGPAPLGSAT